MFKQARAQRSFEAALGLPPGPSFKLSDVIEYIGRTGKAPKEEPTYDFPLAHIHAWYEDAGFLVSDQMAYETAEALRWAKSGLTVKHALEADIIGLSYDGRGKDGPTASLKQSLVDIAKACETIRSALEDMRGELLYRKLNADRHRQLEELHEQLHRWFLCGQGKRAWANSVEFDTAPLLQHGEVGQRATLAPTWLEDALTELAEAALVDQGIRLGRIDPKRPYAANAIKSAFVLDLAKIWTSVIEEPPTISGRDDQVANDQLSSFQIFHQHVCGHIAGLVVRSWGVVWPNISAEQKVWLRDMGLKPIPSPTSLHRYLKAEPN